MRGWVKEARIERRKRKRERKRVRERERKREREEKEEEFHGENQRVYFLEFWLSRRETKVNEEVIQVTNNKKKKVKKENDRPPFS